MAYGDYSGGGGYGSSGLGQIGGGLSAGLRNAIQYNREKDLADKQEKADAWLRDPNNPEYKLKLAQAAAAGRERNSFADAGILDPRLKGKEVSIDQLLPYLAGKIAPGKGSTIGPNGQVKLNEADQKKVGEITQALGNIQQFADVGSANGVWKSGLGNVGNLAADAAYKFPWLAHSSAFQNQTQKSSAFNASKKEASMRLATALFGQRATADKIAEVENLLPGEGLNPQLANQKMNEALNSFRVMANGLVQEKNAAGDTAGAAALEKNLGDIFGNFKIKMPGDPKISSPGAPGIQTTFDPANYDSSTPASVAGASAPPETLSALSAPASGANAGAAPAALPQQAAPAAKGGDLVAKQKRLAELKAKAGK